MSLEVGTRLGPYEVLGLLGAGGMGEVYKARDTRLDRSVAIKVLPERLASDPERRRRFEQEARAVSALNHPHICTLHDVGSAPSSVDGGASVEYLVMECAEGETLADRLLRGPLPLDEVLLYGNQLADALAAAHGRGIVHRDLKPANVMLTKTGVKLLDFGLAKLRGSAADQALALSAMATGAAPITTEGTLLGTLAYMAPEQVEGRDTDARTDLFALGALLYEMVTGRRAFDGESAASVIAAILDREPASLIVISPALPPLLDRITRACLAKSPDARVQSAHDVALQLTWLRETAGDTTTPAGRPPERSGAMHASTAPHRIVRFTIDVPASRQVGAIALSPDGTALAYVGTERGLRQIYVRRMDHSTETPVAGTEGAAASAVAFSPDGSWIGFSAGSSLKRVPSAGGAPVTLLEVPGTTVNRLPGHQVVFDVLDWASDGSILFPAGSSGIWRLADSSAHPAPLTKSDAARGEYGHTFPRLLPDGRHALVTIRRGMQYDEAPLTVVSVETGRQEPIAPDALNATCAGTGHLVYATGGRLLAARFDPVHVRLIGDPVPIVEPLAHRAGVPLFSLSRWGDLAYALEGPQQSGALVRLDRAGREQAVAMLPEGPDGAISITPDGRRMATSRVTSRRMSACVVDIARGILEELPFERSAHSLVWLPDGARVSFSSDRDGAANIFVRDAGSSDPSEKLIPSSQHGDPGSWSRDGRWLAYAEVSPITSWDLWKYDSVNLQASLFLRTDATERNPAISPSGHWLAYASDRSGRYEVYVEAFPAGGQRVQVSADGGEEPAWSHDGRALFYLSGNRLMRVGVRERPDLDLDKPAAMFNVDAYLRANTYGPVSYAVAPDGRSFYFVKPTPVPPGPTRIHVVLGWLDEFTRSMKR